MTPTPLKDRKAQVEAIRLIIASDPFTSTFIRVKAHQLCLRDDFEESECHDLQQSMRLHLMKQARFFNPKRGNVEAFVTRIVTSWVVSELRYRGSPKRMDTFTGISLDEESAELDGQKVARGEVLLEEDGQRRRQRYPLSSLEHVELRDAVECAMRNLRPEDRALLTSVAENGIRGTATAMGVTWRQVKKTLKRLRPHFVKIHPNFEKIGIFQKKRSARQKFA